MAEEKKDNLTEEEIEENEDVEDQTDEGSGESGKDNKSGGDKGSNKGGKSEKTFTQDQVNRMMTREKNQGRNAVYKELGIDPKDTKTVAQFKAFIESQKTEEQKAAEKESADKAKQAESEHRVAVAEAKAEAMMMGVKPQYVEDAVTFLLAGMLRHFLVSLRQSTLSGSVNPMMKMIRVLRVRLVRRELALLSNRLKRVAKRARLKKVSELALLLSVNLVPKSPVTGVPTNNF